MRTVTLGLSGRAAANARFAKAMHGGKLGNFISFERPDLLFKTLTLKRWEILQVLTSKEPVSIREAARLVGRDVKAVHGDITALLNVGILQKTENNKISFPYSRVHVDFMLSNTA
jgi:predicted transcriptional regulator